MKIKQTLYSNQICLVIQLNSAYSAILPLIEHYAEQENDLAALLLGDMHKSGAGVDKDLMRAFQLYSKPANKGNAYAQFWLGFMYDKGYGVTKDDSEAVKWYRKAAEQEFSVAQSNLGFMYYNGEGVKRDYYQAYVWFNVALLFGEIPNNDVSELTRNIEEGKKGWIFDDDPLLSASECQRAKEEARRKYEEIKKRMGWD